jgi:two-component sensor histidine kinase
VSNAAKHAYKAEGVGRIWVSVSATPDNSLSISVRDEGGGLPEDFQIGSGTGMGARMVRALAEQLNASLAAVPRHPGVEFILTAPIAP